MQTVCREFNYIDVSGVGNSGKSAVTDLLREFPQFWVPHNQFEFDVIRVPGGVLDLAHHIVEDWSPVRSHHAIDQFKAVIRSMGTNPSLFNLKGLAQSSSQRYDRVFKNQFQKISNEYVDEFIVGTYKALWPYDFIHQNSIVRFARKLTRRLLGAKQIFSTVYLTDGKEFSARSSHYLNKLYSLVTDSNHTHVVLNNCFEAYLPTRSLDTFKNSKSIIVIRDPRDVYVSGLNAHHVALKDQRLQATENDGTNKSFLASDNLDLFILRYENQMKHLYKGSDPRVLVLNFEELVSKYEITLNRIYSFLDLSLESHREKTKFFDPKKSQKNIGLWREYSKQEEVRKIEAELKDYLWQ